MRAALARSTAGSLPPRFPREAAAYDACKKANGAACLNQLVNDDTALRATATFRRATVTRNTPFERFLAGDVGALSARQRRGAALFFTKATDGGAGCFSYEPSGWICTPHHGGSTTARRGRPACRTLR